MKSLFQNRYAPLVAAALVVVGCAAAPTLAQFVPPDFTTIVIPIDEDTTKEKIMEAGAKILLLVASVGIAFMLARKMISRLRRSI